MIQIKQNAQNWKIHRQKIGEQLSEAEGEGKGE